MRLTVYIAKAKLCMIVQSECICSHSLEVPYTLSLKFIKREYQHKIYILKYRLFFTLNEFLSHITNLYF